MKALLNLGLLLLFVTVQAKVYELCEFARIMNKNGMEGYRGFSLENWVCMAQFVSKFNSKYETHNYRKKLSSYGIFQISSKYWCDDGHTPGASNGCGIPCSVLLQDDITESIKCAKIIVQTPQAIRAWSPWRSHCENRDLTKYLQKCKL
nr:lysozyme C-2-like [Myodes glareolus]